MKTLTFHEEPYMIRDGRKTQTTRVRCGGVAPGDVVGAECVSGGRRRPVGRLRVTGLKRVRLSDLTAEDVAREGYPGMKVSYFVNMLIKRAGGHIDASEPVTKLSFEYVGA